MLEFNGTIYNEAKPSQEIVQRETQKHQPEQSTRRREQKKLEHSRRRFSHPPTKEQRERREDEHKVGAIKEELSGFGKLPNIPLTPEELDKKQWTEWEEGLR